MSPEKAGSLPDFRSLVVSVRLLRTPSYRLHKPRGQAVVTLCGRVSTWASSGPGRAGPSTTGPSANGWLMAGPSPGQSPGTGPTS